jgi:hypothetical protein
MMDDGGPKARHDKYLAQALQADASALTTIDPSQRQMWIDLAVSFRDLAAHVARSSTF